ncbi:DUF2798 domain-containing protein [Holophaga foetida]|uniref:DUF2798 domain-containing protein n=1 Tax=Holophaga foetida TaxID=35839 RepID=UPI00024717D8|nr:DUF2798 domain-containing protein [Holophaga foetida]
MGKSPKESFVFGTLMCAGMVIGMTLYNLVLALGFTHRVIPAFLVGVWPGFFVALLVELLVVGRVAYWVAHRVAHPQESPRTFHITLRTVLMGSMVLIMTVYGTLLHVGFSGFLKTIYLGHLWKNVLMALPLNLLVVTPLVQASFQKLFPQVQTQH